MEKEMFERSVMPRQENIPGDMPEIPGGGCGCGCGETEPVCCGQEGCPADSWGLPGYPLAMVYAPCQDFRALYDPATALDRGTLFTELDLPLGCTNGAMFTTSGASCRAERRS